MGEVLRRREPQPSDRPAKAVKADSKPAKRHKRRWGLVRLAWIRPMVDVMQDAVERVGYAPHSWQHCPPDEVREKYGDALLRHVDDWQDGLRLDRESRLRVLGHVMANAMILLWHELREEGE